MVCSSNYSFQPVASDFQGFLPSISNHMWPDNEDIYMICYSDLPLGVSLRSHGLTGLSGSLSFPLVPRL